MRLKFWECRATQRDLWDYAGERLAEGPMERVERHLETCAACRRDVAEWKRAQGLLATAQADALPTARLGWSDLQARIAADVAAFGPPRPARDDTRQAVAQLIRPRRSLVIGLPGLSALRPALAGGAALTLAFVLFSHRAPKTRRAGSAGGAVPSVAFAAAPLALPTSPVSAFDLTSVANESSAAPSLPTTGKTNAILSAPKARAVKTPPAPRRVANAPSRPLKARTAKVAAIAAPRRAIAAAHPLDSQKEDAIHFTPHNPTTAEKAPDASDVASGVIGTLVPVSHDEDNVYY